MKRKTDTPKYSSRDIQFISITNSKQLFQTNLHRYIRFLSVNVNINHNTQRNERNKQIPSNIPLDERQFSFPEVYNFHFNSIEFN